MGKENKNEVLKFQEPALQRKQSCIKRLSDDQKRMILHAHLVNGVSKAELARVFGIRRETIWRWISTFAEGSQPVGKPKGVCSRAKEYSNLNPKPMPQKTASRLETPEEELARLRRENAELEEALKMAEWSNHAKDVMIDLAEKTFNIPIRKKSGAKQQRSLPQRRSRARPWAFSVGCLARAGRLITSTRTHRRNSA